MEKIFRRRVLLITFGCGLGLAIVVSLLVPREPSYGGRKLSQWVDTLGNRPDWQEEMAATNAIVHIGARASPYLAEWIWYDLYPLERRKKLIEMYSKLPAVLKSKWLEKWVYGKPRRTRKPSHGGDVVTTSIEASERAEGAKLALEILGPKAKGAIPGLGPIALAKEPGAMWSAVMATRILSHLGPEALPALIAVLTNGYYERAEAAQGIQAMGTNARAAIPALLMALQDRDQYVRLAASEALYDVAPEVAIKAGILLPLRPQGSTEAYYPRGGLPRILEDLTNQYPKTRRLALDCIMNMGTNARPLVPALLNALHDPDLLVRMRATNCLRYIDPEAFKQVGSP